MTYRSVDISALEPVPARDGARPDLQWISVEKLVVDERYQRPLGRSNMTAIRAIALAFDWAEFTACLVAPVGDGRFAIIDGQHRTHAAALTGHIAVPCLVMPMDLAQQARSFAGVNGRVTAITPFHILKAALAAREPWAVEAVQTVASTGCELMTANWSANAKKPGQVFAVALIRKALASGHKRLIVQMLEAVRACDHADDVRLYTSGFLGPMLSVLVDHPWSRALDLVAFLNDCDPATMGRAVNKLRDLPEYGRRSQKWLMAEALRVRLKSWARDQVVIG
ncbi:MAG: ParB/Srx family N-terminal domain-containing protein [Pseudomonadota bacterium]